MTPIPVSPITRPHSLQRFLPGLRGIYIFAEQLQRICKILKLIKDSAVHILRAYEKQRFCPELEMSSKSTGYHSKQKLVYVIHRRVTEH